MRLIGNNLAAVDAFQGEGGGAAAGVGGRGTDKFLESDCRCLEAAGQYQGKFPRLEPRTRPTAFEFTLATAYNRLEDHRRQPSSDRIQGEVYRFNRNKSSSSSSSWTWLYCAG